MSEALKNFNSNCTNYLIFTCKNCGKKVRELDFNQEICEMCGYLE